MQKFGLPFEDLVITCKTCEKCAIYIQQNVHLQPLQNYAA